MKGVSFMGLGCYLTRPPLACPRRVDLLGGWPGPPFRQGGEIGRRDRFHRLGKRQRPRTGSTPVPAIEDRGFEFSPWWPEQLTEHRDATEGTAAPHFYRRFQMTWEEAVKVLPKLGAMENNKNDVVTIRCGYDFEPHGQASETWEVVWEVRLHTVPSYWHGTDGWHRGAEGNPGPYFRGRTEAEAKAKAITYIETAPWRNT